MIIEYKRRKNVKGQHVLAKINKERANIMNFSDAIDISMDINEKTVVWVEDPPPELRPVLRQPEHECNFTWLNFGAHAGTHVDAPYFLFPEKWSIDEIPLTRLLGLCQVLDLTEVDDMITEKDFVGVEISCEKILLRTKNSFDKMEAYNPQHVAMSLGAAEYLAAEGVTTLGYDYQSFERDGANVLHRFFLERSTTLIDNLRLLEAPAGDYTLICLPIKLTGIDAAPCRAILLPTRT